MKTSPFTSDVQQPILRIDKLTDDQVGRLIEPLLLFIARVSRLQVAHGLELRIS